MPSRHSEHAGERAVSSRQCHAFTVAEYRPCSLDPQLIPSCMHATRFKSQLAQLFAKPSNANQERFYAIYTLLCDSKGYTQQPAPAIPAPFLPKQSIMVRAHIDGLRSTPPFQPTAPHDTAGIHTQDVPLSELFRQAQTLVGQAAAMSATEAVSRARQAEALWALARCDQLVDSLALFSRCLSITRAFAFFTNLWCGG